MTTITTEFEKQLDKLRKSNEKANASAAKVAQVETEKANEHQRQADEHTEKIASIDAAWTSGDETPSASDRASAVAERDRAQALAKGRTAAANKVKAGQVNSDTGAAENVAKAIRASISNAYPVHVIGTDRKQETPTPNANECPVVLVRQVEPAKRAQDGSLSGEAGVMSWLPQWAAPIDFERVRDIAAKQGIELNVPDSTFSTRPDPDADGVVTEGHRVSVRRGSEDLPIIPEIERDGEKLIDAVQPVLAHLDSTMDDLIYGVQVQVGERSRLPKDGQSIGVQISFRRQVVEAERRKSQGVRWLEEEEAEARANRMALMGEKPVGKVFRKSEGDEARQAFASVASETVGTFLPGIGVVSEVSTDIIDVKSLVGSLGHKHGHSRYVVTLKAVSRTA